MSYKCILSPKADHNALFAMVEEALRERHPNHILPTSQKEWMFMNAGVYINYVSSCIENCELSTRAFVPTTVVSFIVE